MTTDLTAYYRASSGPGWAFAGDAGHFKDPVTGNGMRDALKFGRLLGEAAASSLYDPEALDAALRRGSGPGTRTISTYHWGNRRPSRGHQPAGPRGARTFAGDDRPNLSDTFDRARPVEAVINPLRLARGLFHAITAPGANRREIWRELRTELPIEIGIGRPGCWTGSGPPGPPPRNGRDGALRRRRHPHPAGRPPRTPRPRRGRPISSRSAHRHLGSGPSPLALHARDQDVGRDINDIISVRHVACLGRVETDGAHAARNAPVGITVSKGVQRLERRPGPPMPPPSWWGARADLLLGQTDRVTVRGLRFWSASSTSTSRPWAPLEARPAPQPLHRRPGHPRIRRSQTTGQLGRHPHRRQHRHGETPTTSADQPAPQHNLLLSAFNNATT